MRIFPLLFACLWLVSSTVADTPTRAGWIKAVMANPAKKAVLIAAHRGGYANDKKDEAPENSLSNVWIARAKKFDLYETDIQRTKDGVFVIMHDETIDRETTGQGKASDLTLPELKSLHKRYRDGSPSKEKVATLEELLREGHSRILFKADLKPGLVDSFDGIARLITSLNMVDDVFIRCSLKEAAVIEAMYADGTPRVELMVKVDRTDQVRDVAKRFSPKTIQINVEKGEVLSPEKREAIRTAVDLGMLVETHAYGDEAQWRDLIAAGVRMFHTAVPDETVAWLQENGWRY
jgi:glycerophosphoryl diester phosphodiesterase